MKEKLWIYLPYIMIGILAGNILASAFLAGKNDYIEKNKMKVLTDRVLRIENVLFMETGLDGKKQ